MSQEDLSGAGSVQNMEWPANELETLGCCPICKSTDRTLRHAKVSDRLFGSAPGGWQIYACEKCQSSYVDPRPNVASIGRAYANYFTHEAVEGDPGGSPGSGVGQRIKAWMNAYRNRRWGMNLRPASAWPALAWCLTLPLHSLAVANMRHLPKLLPRPGARLLDVGCGNGDFLAMARAAGWEVQGIDFDPQAVEAARRKDLAVQVGGLDQIREIKNNFDYITCSHVIEHVHAPREWIAAMHGLLKQGGTLWIQTPNINSVGYRRFGADWLNLDPPRHLVLFTPQTLASLLREVGLSLKMHKLPMATALWIYADSKSFSRGHARMGGGVRWQSALDLRSLKDAFVQSVGVRRAEFITFTAQRAE